MAVAVHQPQRKDDAFDKIAKGLAVANSILGIKQGLEDRQLKKDQLAADQERQKVLDARQDEAYAQQKQDRDFAMQGGISPAQQVDLASKGFTFGAPGAEGAPQVSIRTPQGIQQASVVAPKKETGLTAYQKEMIELQKWKIAGQQSKDDVQRTKIANEGARKLSDAIEKTGITEVYTALDKLNKKIGIDGTDDIPGVGQTASLPGLVISQDGKEVRQLVQQLTNTILKARSGGAVTPQEADRLLEELGTGLTKTDEDLRRGLRSVRDMFRAKVALAESGAPEDSLALYRQRKGAIHSDSDVFRSLDLERAITDADIEEELKRRSSGATASW